MFSLSMSTYMWISIVAHFQYLHLISSNNSDVMSYEYGNVTKILEKYYVTVKNVYIGEFYCKNIFKHLHLIPWACYSSNILLNNMTITLTIINELETHGSVHLTGETGMLEEQWWKLKPFNFSQTHFLVETKPLILVLFS